MNLRTRKFTVAALLFAAVTLAPSSWAQATASTTASSSGAPTVMERFEVTGSYLPVSSLVTASPVVTLESAEIGMSGTTDALQLLKQMTPFFQGNGNIGTELNNGGAGESNVALRNLTTLVLLNGQRLPISAVSATNGSGGAVDLNTIPTSMIERIEILKDGASTVYGSDAVGGVVNVILKKNYTGFETGARYGTDRHGDYITRNLYIVGGLSQPGYSLTFGAQHFENTTLRTTDRPLTTLSPKQIAALGYNVTSAVYSPSYSGRVQETHILAGSPLAVGAPRYNAAMKSPPAKTSPSAPPQTIAQLDAAGIYIPLNSTPAFQDVGSASILNTTLYGNPLIVPTKRNVYMLAGNKELFGKNLEVFGHFLYANTINGGSGLAPSPIVALGAAGGNSLVIPANNPYNFYGVTLGVGQGPGSPRIRYRMEDFGNRSSSIETNTWQFMGGLKGSLTEKFSWESTFNYSRSSATQRVLGGGNGANLITAMRPLVRNGQYVYNSAGLPLSELTDASGNNLPVFNYFALPGVNDPATIDALRVTLFQTGETTLRDIRFLLRGKVFQLPAGEVAVAAGVQGRREELSAAVDGLFANGLALGYNAANTFPGGGNSRSTKGAFIEVGVPLVSPKEGVPLVHTLEANLADRYEKIQPGGNANSPKVGLRWLPFDDQFVFRGTWAKGFIAPPIYFLFGPSNSNSPTFSIPRGDGRSSAGGTMAGSITIQGNAVELANPTLQPSKSESWTGGIVYSPKQIKGLTFTLDYFRIEQDKVGEIDYSAIVADLNARGAASVYNQDPLRLGQGFVFADGSRLTSNAANQVNHTNFGTISVAQNPQGDQKTDGLDLGVDYRFRTDAYGNFSVGAQANVLFNFKFRATPRDPYYQYARVFTDSTVGGAGYQGLLPGYTIKPYLTHSYKHLSTALFGTYYPKVNVPGELFPATGSAANGYTINGRASETPNYFRLDATVSARLPAIGFLKNMTLTVGANNVFDKDAPYVPTDGSLVAENNTVKNAYDIIGRFWFFELKKSF